MQIQVKDIIQFVEHDYATASGQRAGLDYPNIPVAVYVVLRPDRFDLVQAHACFTD